MGLGLEFKVEGLGFRPEGSRLKVQIRQPKARFRQPKARLGSPRPNSGSPKPNLGSPRPNLGSPRPHRRHGRSACGSWAAIGPIMRPDKPDPEPKRNPCDSYTADPVRRRSFTWRTRHGSDPACGGSGPAVTPYGADSVPCRDRGPVSPHSTAAS